MQSRRTFIKLGAFTSLALTAGVGSMSAQESTPAGAAEAKSGVLTNVADKLPKAPDGEIAVVAWGGDKDTGAAFVLIHNATADELIVRQGGAKALDPDGKVTSEIEKVTNTAPYSYAPGAWGVQEIEFEGGFGEAASIEVEISTSPLSEATGDLTNIPVTSVEMANERQISVTVRNDSDKELIFVPIVGVFFDDDMQIVGGTSNMITPLAAGSEGSIDIDIAFGFGEMTENYLFGAFGQYA